MRRERTSRWLSSRGQRLGALARDVDVQSGVGDPDDDVVVEPQGQAEGVEARTEIGAGGGDAHPDGGGAERWTGHRSMTLLVLATRLLWTAGASDGGCCSEVRDRDTRRPTTATAPRHMRRGGFGTAYRRKVLLAT